VHSAHIATYGERGVDVFYVAGADGRKLEPDEITRLRKALLVAASDDEQAGAVA
jgi:UTP:GlnB (protein PII) uridylyltransferase